MKCGWCGKGDDQVETLIAGSDANICNLCVDLCKEAINQFTSRVAPGAKRPECSFCKKEPWTHKRRLTSGNGAHICQDCLELCDDVLDNVFWARATGEKDLEPKSDAAETSVSEAACGPDADAVEREPEPLPARNSPVLSDMEQEWAQLVYEATDKKQLLQRGAAWVRKNKMDQAAGEAAAQLLEIRPTASIVSIAESWLSQYPDHEGVAIVLGALIMTSPSRKSVRLAGQYIQSLSNLRKSEPIIKAAIQSQNVSLAKRVGQAMEQYPTDWIWFSALHPYPRRNRTSEKLLAKWMHLHRDSSDAGMGFTSAMTSHSPQVIEACFDWMRAGGLIDDQMPSILADLLGRAKIYHKALFPRLVRFARKLLKTNSQQKNAGKLHAALFSATRSKSDVRNAKQWYEEHEADQYAWYVIANLLEDAYLYGYKPEQCTVDKAKLLLRQNNFRFEKPRLVGALVGASADEESIAWAREAYRRHSPYGPLWILRRLLLRAPDDETIATAVQESERWKDHKDEPQMLYALLYADPGNTLALRRVKLWKKRNPKNKWIKAINH